MRRLATTLYVTLSATMIGTASPASPAEDVHAKAAVPVLSVEAALAKVDQHFRELAEGGNFSGSFLVAKDGRTLFARGYGLANRETREPVTPDTRFNLASLNKFITRIAVYQLVEAGKLSLDDTVGAVLPDLPNKALRENVTIRHLLDMKAGVPDIFNDRFRARRLRLRTTDDFLALFVEEPLRFEPGEKREYSNGGYVVLGKIIEEVSGMPYSEYVERYISRPAGMTSTALDAPIGSAGTAIGYTRAPEMFADPNPEAPLRSNEHFLPARGSSAGGGYSTVRDFARLDAALRSGTLLKPATSDLFFGPGFRTGTGRSAGWAGGASGVSTGFMMFPDGLTFVVFANMDPPAGTAAGEAALRILRQAMPRPAQQPTNSRTTAASGRRQ